MEYGFGLIPKTLSTEAYAYIFKYPAQILNSYSVTGAVTIIGSLLSLLIIAMIAFPLSRPDFKHKNKIAFYVYFTMLFNGGLVPTYLVVAKYLGLKDTLWALILPYLVNAWFILLLRTFFQKIPFSIIESVKIDGGSEYRIFFSIILPLSKPALATVGLFILLQYWNDWFLGLLYIDSDKLVPLQFLLYRMMANMEFLSQAGAVQGIDVSKFPSESARMAMCIIAAGPVLFVFPFFQKYFVKGLTVGAVKG